MKPNKMLLMACRGDKALAGHLKGLGYEISWMWCHYYYFTIRGMYRVYQVEKHKKGISTAILSSYHARGYFHGKGIVSQSAISIISGLVALPTEDLPLILASRLTTKSVLDRGALLVGKIEVLLQDLLEYKTR